MTITQTQTETEAPYEPSRSLVAKVARRLTPLRARRLHHFELNTPIVTLTFDDFPVSAFDNGAQRIEREGWRGTFYVACGLKDSENHHGPQFSARHITALQAAGHDFGGHSYSHTDCAALSEQAVLAEITRNEAALRDMGVPVPCSTFAYPFGATQPGLKRALSGRYRAMRGVLPGAHTNRVDLNQVRSMPLFSGPKLSAALDEIKALKTRPAWLTLFAHDIRDNPSPWGCTPAEFERVIKAIKESGADVLTMDGALNRIGAPHV